MSTSTVVGTIPNIVSIRAQPGSPVLVSLKQLMVHLHTVLMPPLFTKAGRQGRKAEALYPQTRILLARLLRWLRGCSQYPLRPLFLHAGGC